MLSVPTILILSLFILGLSYLLVGNPKKFIDFFKKNGIFVIAFALFLSGLSLCIHVERHSGEGVLTLFGWPHFYYQTWNSFDGQTNMHGVVPGLLWVYPLSTLVFNGSIATFLLMVYRRRSSKLKGRMWHD